MCPLHSWKGFASLTRGECPLRVFEPKTAEVCRQGVLNFAGDVVAEGATKVESHADD